MADCDSDVSGVVSTDRVTAASRSTTTGGQYAGGGGGRGGGSGKQNRSHPRRSRHVAFGRTMRPATSAECHAPADAETKPQCAAKGKGKGDEKGDGKRKGRVAWQVSQTPSPASVGNDEADSPRSTKGELGADAADRRATMLERRRRVRAMEPPKQQKPQQAQAHAKEWEQEEGAQQQEREQLESGLELAPSSGRNSHGSDEAARPPAGSSHSEEEEEVGSVSNSSHRWDSTSNDPAPSAAPTRSSPSPVEPSTGVARVPANATFRSTWWEGQLPTREQLEVGEQERQNQSVGGRFSGPLPRSELCREKQDKLMSEVLRGGVQRSEHDARFRWPGAPR
jgi:hypothetical protein